MARTGKISQTKIAHELGISQALVSLVLNGRKQNISPETYDRIWQHAMKRGYHPKGMKIASTPANAQLRSAGLILRAPLRLNSLGTYFGDVQHGYYDTLQKKGLSSVFLGSEDQLGPAQLAPFFHAGHSLQGVAIIGEVSRNFLLELRRHERRIVAISARFLGLCHSVLGNEPQAMEQLVSHLHALGHRRFGWLGGNLGMGRHEERLAAFKFALKQYALELPARYSIQLKQADRAEGVEAVHDVLAHAKRKDFPTAFVCYNGLMAHGAARAFQREGWSVPGRVSLASADSPRADLDKPTITGAGSSPELLGVTAAKLLFASTGDDSEFFNDVMLPSQLVVGESTGPAA